MDLVSVIRRAEGGDNERVSKIRTPFVVLCGVPKSTYYFITFLWKVFHSKFLPLLALLCNGEQNQRLFWCRLRPCLRYLGNCRSLLTRVALSLMA